MQDLHSLALEGGKAAAKILGTGLLENEAGEFTACMVNILLMPVDVNNKALIATQLKTFQEAQFEAKVFSAVVSLGVLEIAMGGEAAADRLHLTVRLEWSSLGKDVCAGLGGSVGL